VIYSSW